MTDTRPITHSALIDLRAHVAKWFRAGIDNKALTAADAALAAQPAQEAALWQWRKKGGPWTLEKTFNTPVIATTDDSEVRVLYAAPSPSQAPTAAQPAQRCQGMNCGATDGKSHSLKCFAEHAATVDPGVGERHREARYAGYKGEPFPFSASEDERAAWMVGFKARHVAAPQPAQGEDLAVYSRMTDRYMQAATSAPAAGDREALRSWVYTAIRVMQRARLNAHPSRCLNWDQADASQADYASELIEHFADVALPVPTQSLEQERKPLTEQHLQALGLEVPSVPQYGYLLRFARAIEAAHGIAAPGGEDGKS